MTNAHGQALRKAASSLDRGRRIALVLCLLLELVMMVLGLLPAVWMVLALGPRCAGAFAWTGLILAAVLVFNYGYLIALLIARVLIPYTPEGRVRFKPGQRPPGRIFLLALNLSLSKARYEPPWAQTFSSVLANVFPLRPLFRRFFGPHTESSPLGDTCGFLDPYLVYAGKNVRFGWDAAITCHVFDRQGLMVKRVVIEDDVILGAGAGLMPGVHVGRGATIAVRAIVAANTRIGPNEVWAGNPARCVGRLGPRSDGDEETT